jgi:MFS family permease
MFKKSYFDGKISRGFLSLFMAKTIVMVASGLLGIFLPIFLYNLFDKNFRYVVLYYGTAHLLYGTFVGLGAIFLNKFGFRRALRMSTFLGALFYSIFYFIDKGNLIYLIPFSILVLTLYRLFYWVPYHVDFAKFTDRKDKAEAVSIISATRNIIGVFIPVIAGLIISHFSFNLLFVIAIILYLFSFIPYLIIPKTREKFSWTYRESWKNFFLKKNRKTIFAFMSYGAENLIGIVVWPIFIFGVLRGNYFQVGLISTLIIGITVVFQLSVGKYIDNYAKEKKVLKIGTLLVSFGWIFKIFIATAFQIFVVGAYHSLSSILTKTPFDSLRYETAADEGHYVDEQTVLYEMAIQSGKVLMAILVIIISIFFAIQWTFLLAAVTTLALNLIRTKTGGMVFVK